MPVSTTSNNTCPDACPLKRNGCYAESGPLALHWAKISEGLRGLNWSEFCAAIASLPIGQLWRHNQAGDLPGIGNTIDRAALRELTTANAGKRGYTYTHKPLTPENAEAIAEANRTEFTINLSADTVEQADRYKAMGIGPVAVVLPHDVSANFKTPAGNQVTICPATNRENVSCSTCKLCARKDRACIVGFPAHGTRKKAFKPELIQVTA